MDGPQGLIVAVKTRNKSGNVTFQSVERVEEGPHMLRIIMLDGSEQLFRWDYVDWCAVVPAEVYAERLQAAVASQRTGIVAPNGEQIDAVVDGKNLD